jgi:hypothetical protein
VATSFATIAPVAFHAQHNALREAGEAEPKPDERAEGGAVPPPAA